MPLLETGRVCYKIKGRDAGAKVVVLEMQKDGFVVVEGKRTKKGRCNPAHLLPTDKQLTITTHTKREDLVKQMEGA